MIMLKTLANAQMGNVHCCCCCFCSCSCSSGQSIAICSACSKKHYKWIQQLAWSAQLTLLARNICQHIQLTETYAPLFVVISFVQAKLRQKMPEIYGELWTLSAFHSDLCVCLVIYTMLNTFVYDRRRDTYVYFNECQEEAEEQTHKHFALSKSIFHWRSTLTHHSCGCALVTMLTD